MKINKKDRFIRNVIANFGIRLWTVISNFIFIPFYIQFLGVEAYGLVTFFSTLQTMMNLLGLGLSKTIRREFAVLESDNYSSLRKYKLLRSVETIYAVVAILIIVICIVGSELIATNWLSFEELSITVVKNTISLMGISIGLQLLTGMYQGCLFGLERQVEADIIQFLWSAFKNVGVIVCLWIFSFGLIEFYLWYIFFDLIYLIVLRYRVIYHLHTDRSALEWKLRDIKNIKSIWKYAVGLFFISVSNIGFDKIIVSSNFDLTSLGVYNTITMLGNLSLIISASVGIAVFSRFANLKSKNEYDMLRKFYFDINYLVNILVSCLGAFVAIYSKEIILVWTHSDEIANISEDSAPILIIALTIAALQQISYEYLLAIGVTIIDNIRSVLTILAIIKIMPIGIKQYGLLGASLILFIINSVSIIIYLGVINRQYAKRFWILGLIKDFIMPLFSALLLAYCSRIIVHNLFVSSYLRVLAGILCGSVTIAFMLWGSAVMKKRKS